MKKFYFLLIAIIYCGSVLAQNQANDWILGDWGTNSYYPLKDKGTKIDFSTGLADTFQILKRMPIDITDANIADSNGHVLLYTSGIYVSNRNNDTLWNSENFNPGEATDFYKDGGMGYGQAAIILPDPGDRNQYYIFHESADPLNYGGGVFLFAQHLSYSKVDMRLDSGLGGIIDSEKDIHLFYDTLYNGQLTACKHGNGRDWWLIVKKYLSNQYYVVLITPKGIEKVSKQLIGNKVGYGTICGEAQFSPDGSKYAFVNVSDTIDYMKFDRCSGEFSNYKMLTVPFTTPYLNWALGCSFSPNNRYLYVNTYLEIFQYDTWADDIQSSVKRVALFDTSLETINYFFTQQLAPDGRIYMSTFDSFGTYELYYINKPNKSWDSCEFHQQGIPLNSANSGVPNLPNYDLGPLPDSLCDTSVTSVPLISQTAFSHYIYPNPCYQKFQLIISGVEKDVPIVIYNTMGEIIYQTTLQPQDGFIHGFFNLQNEPSGIYLLKAESNRGEVTEKIVKQ